MSDIDIQIEKNKGIIQGFKEQIKILNTEIDGIQKNLPTTGDARKNERKMIKLRKEQIQMINTNISKLERSNKQLERSKLRQSNIQLKSNDPFSSIYNPTNIPSDQDVSKDYEHMVEQTEPSILNSPIPSENYLPSPPPSNHSTPEGEEISSIIGEQQQHILPSTPEEDVSSVVGDVGSNKSSKHSTPKSIELIDLNSNTPTPQQVPLEKDVEINEKHFVVKTGFRETLKPAEKKESVKLDENICQNIFTNGLNINKGHFFPSQFPKLTRIKSITASNKKGGKRKSRKSRKRRKRRK